MLVPLLPDPVRQWLETARVHPEVRGVALTGSVARGDHWPGSDLDLYVLWAVERRADLGGIDLREGRVEGPGGSGVPTLGGVCFADIHHLPAAEVAQLTDDLEAFAVSTVVDETAGGVALHDPDALVGGWLATVAERLADPNVRRLRARRRLDAAVSALQAAVGETDSFQAALLARDASRLGAFAHVVGGGGLIASARRFPERFRLAAPPQLADALERTWGLGGGRAAVDAAIAGLHRALRGTVEAFLRHPPLPGEDRWVTAYRGATAGEREALIAGHPHPPLLAPALAHGYTDGALMWMRGFYRLRLGELLATLPRAEWPIADLRAFYGLRGDECDTCRGFLGQVEASLLYGTGGITEWWGGAMVGPGGRT